MTGRGRTVEDAGYDMDDVLPTDRVLRVRRTANLHTGGTIHDVTSKLHPTLVEASVAASRALDIPVVGLDLMVPDVERPDYVFIEANERPGLANHEPQPTVDASSTCCSPRRAVADVLLGPDAEHARRVVETADRDHHGHELDARQPGRDQDVVGRQQLDGVVAKDAELAPGHRGAPTGPTRRSEQVVGPLLAARGPAATST